MNPQRLKTILSDLVACRDLQAKELPNGELETYCNLALLRVAVAFGCKDFASVPNANTMCDLMQFAIDWTPGTGEQAQAWADKGMLAVACKKAEGHGHVAAVCPADSMYFSPSLKKNVPWLANVGKTNGILPASRCFPVAEGEPSYFLWTGCSGY